MLTRRVDDARRRALRDAAKQRLKVLADALADRERLVRDGRLMLGGLRHVGWSAGRSDDWLWERLFPLAERHPEVLLHGRIPQRVAS